MVTEREVQPDQEERREAERHRARRAGQLRIAAAPAPEKHERQRDQDLHRRLERHGVRERQRQAEDAQRGERGALRAGEQRIAAGREVGSRAAASSDFQLSRT